MPGESAPAGESIASRHKLTGRFFVSRDSGYPRAATYAALAAERFDVLAPELTIVSAADGITHMDLGDVLLLLSRLRAAGAIDPWTRVATIHQSPQGSQVLPDVNRWQQHGATGLLAAGALLRIRRASHSCGTCVFLLSGTSSH